MSDRSLEQFLQLKQAVEKTYCQAHPYCTKPIHEWRGQDIVDFQEHLQQSVQGRISEKWFYTHFKTQENERLPRVDMLNLLSEYAGYRNWQEFSSQAESQEDIDDQGERAGAKRRIPVWIGVLLLVGMGIGGWMLSGMLTAKSYTFCFVDKTTGNPIPDTDIWILEEGQSPKKKTGNAEGCVKLLASQASVRFAVSAPYYRPDTIIRNLDTQDRKEEIELHPDDYALMIHYFSTNNQKEWKKRREQLNEIFSDQARIFQLSPNQQFGMELYNKKEFIDKLTTPIRSLGKIEILETKYDKGKIVSLRFIQTE